MKKAIIQAGFFAALAALAVMTFTLAACAKKNESAGTLPGSGDSERLPVLKIGARDWVYVAEAKGFFRPFTDNGTRIEIVQGVLGNEVPMFARGDVHFFQRMLYPFLQFKAKGADLIAIQASTHPLPEVTSVFVRTDSPYQTLADLQGQKIASWRASCPYMVLFELTEGLGWKEGKNWQFVNTREYREALISGEVEAFCYHPQDNLAALLTTGAAREVAYSAPDSLYVNGGGITVQFTTSGFAEKYPGIVRKYVEVMDQTFLWILDNTGEAAAIIEQVTRAPQDVQKLTWSRQTGNWYTERDLAKIVRETETMQEWLVSHGDIDPGSRVDIRSIFDARFFD
jgi:ABC-type nitrate/sulfonate/bicarbonate transport system substrate-binding protein